MAGVILIVSFVLLLLCNVPIAVTLGLSSIFTLLASDMSLAMVPMNYYSASSKFVLLSIPFFILGGNIMAKAMISTRLITLAESVIGHRRGGLAIVCVLTSCFFAAISGSGPATVAALGMLVIPAMINVGYDKADASALMSVSGTIGLIIPPSILFVIFGSITGVSVTRLFMSGIIPGLLMGAMLIGTCLFINRKRPLKLLPKATAKERRAAFRDAVWGLLMPVIVLGGIYGGVFTPTEAAAVSAVYGLVVGICVYRTVSLRVLYEIIIDSVMQTAVVMFITAAAGLFAWVITINGYAAAATSALVGVSGGNLFVLLIIINVILLIAGCFLDGASACYIFVPIIFAAATQLGFNPVALGVVIVMNLAIGNATPPVGVCLYVACGVGKVSLKEISIAVVPYIIASIVALALITYVPQISLFLPGMMK